MATRDAGTEPVSLDDIDRRIISELTRDGRMSVTQVAENVHISRAHAYTRIGRLTSEGVLLHRTVPAHRTKPAPPVEDALTEAAMWSAEIVIGPSSR